MRYFGTLYRLTFFKNFALQVEKWLGCEVEARYYFCKPLAEKPRVFVDEIFMDASCNGGEFILDVRFNYDERRCELYNIEIPSSLRRMGIGTRIVRELEKMAREFGLESVYVPAEHESVFFWLKLGYSFANPLEESFFYKNKERGQLYLAYDMRKYLASHPPRSDVQGPSAGMETHC